MTGRDDPAEVAGLADRIVAAVTGCAAVAGLTEAPGGPVATYLPGRTISGVAVRDGEVEVCVVARYGLPLLEVAEQVRQAVAPLVPDRVVDVVIGDITLAEAEDKGPDGRDQPGLSGQQAAFRAWVRAHHPDLGGDPEAFAEGLRQWRARMTGLPPVPGPTAAAAVVYRRRRGAAGWVAHWRRRRQRLRSLRLR